MTDIESRLGQVAGALDANLTALNATRAGLAEVIDALAGGGRTAVRLANSLANIDGLIAMLRANGTSLEGLDAAVGLTVATIREIRHQDRLQWEAQAREGRPYLHVVGE